MERSPTQQGAPWPDTLAPERPWAIQRLPPFPAVALQLLSLLDDEETPIQQIVGLLRVDPALSAEILRVSNSALYGLSRRIDNISHAVVVLGTDVVRRLSLTVALGRFTQPSLCQDSLRVCWDHSVAAAMLAEKVAQALALPTARAYTAGLLHDVGRLALLSCYPLEYHNMLEVARENDFDHLECERQLFDIDHVDAGEWLTRHWRLPDDLIAAASQHHQPMVEGAADLLTVVQAADQLADRFGYGVIRPEAGGPVADVLAQLPLQDPETLLEELEGFEERIQKAIVAISPR